MRKNLRILLALSIAVILVSSTYVARAQQPNIHAAIPEKNGTYNDPDHPGVKVRVFVHPERPTKAETAILNCNLLDPDSTSIVSATPWKLPTAWTYNLNPASVPSSVGGTNLPTITANGFAAWEAATNNHVFFSRGADTRVDRQAYDKRNIIAWGRTSGSALGVTYVRYYPSTGQVVDVDTIMNKKFAWKWSTSLECADPAAYDAENIMTHELGHWLGLDDEYDNSYLHNTMYGYGAKGEVKKNTLTTGDIQGTLTIYP
jgi:hypothetical protein